jgi:hypothetical protein
LSLNLTEETRRAAVQRWTGLLRIDSPRPAELAFAGGRLVDAASGSERGLDAYRTALVLLGDAIPQQLPLEMLTSTSPVMTREEVLQELSGCEAERAALGTFASLVAIPTPVDGTEVAQTDDALVDAPLEQEKFDRLVQTLLAIDGRASIDAIIGDRPPLLVVHEIAELAAYGLVRAPAVADTVRIVSPVREARTVRMKRLALVGGALLFSLGCTSVAIRMTQFDLPMNLGANASAPQAAALSGVPIALLRNPNGVLVRVVGPEAQHTSLTLDPSPVLEHETDPVAASDVLETQPDAPAEFAALTTPVALATALPTQVRTALPLPGPTAAPELAARPTLAREAAPVDERPAPAVAPAEPPVGVERPTRVSLRHAAPPQEVEVHTAEAAPDIADSPDTSAAPARHADSKQADAPPPRASDRTSDARPSQASDDTPDPSPPPPAAHGNRTKPAPPAAQANPNNPDPPAPPVANTSKSDAPPPAQVNASSSGPSRSQADSNKASPPPAQASSPNQQPNAIKSSNPSPQDSGKKADTASQPRSGNAGTASKSGSDHASSGGKNAGTGGP